MLPKTAATETFWQAFRRHSGLRDVDYVVVRFGDNATMNDEVGQLVLDGTKRATTSLARDYGEGREALPAVGDYVVVIDGAHVPRCIWRTTEIEVKPLIAVDDEFARDEGEGDRTRAGWLSAHRAYFARQASREGFTVTDDIMTVFERFEIVWPLEIALSSSSSCAP